MVYTRLVCAFLLCSSVSVLGQKQPDTPPNVILILADDLGFGDLSSLNQGLSKTPALDRLRQQGMWFTQAYSASPVCAPARAALLTGQYPHRTGAVTLDMVKYPELTRIRKGLKTIGDLFRENGYTTGLIGKWHSGMGEEYHPRRRGFDEFEGFVGAQYVPTYFNFRLDVGGEIRQFTDRYLTDELSDRAIQFVRRHQDQPFFLHLAHSAPHRPLGAPQALVDAFLARGLDKETATVYAMVEVMDRGIGQLLEELERLDLAKNTIVIFSSDNGPDPLVHQRFNLDLRGAKYEVHEGGIHVPFIVRWPAKITPGESARPVTFVDVIPTLMDLCKLKPAGLAAPDGTSFAGTLAGKKGTPDRSFFWQWNRHLPMYSHNAAMRRGRWKLVRPYVTREIPKKPSELSPLLFDLVNDPGEQQDLSQKHPKRVRKMNAELEKWAREVEADRVR